MRGVNRGKLEQKKAGKWKERERESGWEYRFKSLWFRVFKSMAFNRPGLVGHNVGCEETVSGTFIYIIENTFPEIPTGILSGGSKSCLFAPIKPPANFHAENLHLRWSLRKHGTFSRRIKTESYTCASRISDLMYTLARSSVSAPSENTQRRMLIRSPQPRF